MRAPHTDIHQHLWPEDFIAALARRQTPPLIRCRGGRWILQLVGEPEYPFSLDWHDPERRRRANEAAGIERAVIAISSPLGIEWLPGEEGAELLAAHNHGTRHLGAGFATWGAVSVLDGDAATVDRLLADGHAGLSLPAESISTQAGLDQLRPVLDALEVRGAPLFVHPGPVYASDRLGTPGGDPGWWPALTGYVNQMNRAWHALVATGRDRHPSLKVVFAMLAGGAPLHGERLTARGGPAVGSDPNFFYDTSSYGTRGIDAAIRVAGIDQLVHGTDAPVVDAVPDPGLGPAALEAIRSSNPARVFAGSRTAVLA